jgi:16S rRNA processing protein RimM
VSTRVRVAHVRRAHGLRGELLVRALIPRPDALFTPGRELFAAEADAPTLRLQSARTTHDGWLLSIEGIQDRSEAERWRGQDLWAAHAELTALGDDTLFAGDLVGLQMELTDGTLIGTVANYYELPQGPMLEVARADDHVLFPLHPDFVSRIDAVRGVVVVDPPAGLFD